MDRRRVRRQHQRLRRQRGVVLVRGVLQDGLHHLRRRPGGPSPPLEGRRAVRGRVREHRRLHHRQRHRVHGVHVLRAGAAGGFVDHRGAILRGPGRGAGDAGPLVQPLRVHRRPRREARGDQRPRRHLRRVVRPLRTGRDAHLRRPPLLGRLPQATRVPTSAAGPKLLRRRPRRRGGVPDVVQGEGDLPVQGRERRDRLPGLLRDALWRSHRRREGPSLEDARAARRRRRRRPRHHRVGHRVHVTTDESSLGESPLGESARPSTPSPPETRASCF
mmetsp:Transcript_7575/g.30707  ORF Transcript_7575/g.30707 Transcript_7575/m.30707 type:complete len:275 (+) Transcript_7575:916-1740(+)